MHVLFNLIFPEQSHIFMKAANQTKKKHNTNPTERIRSNLCKLYFAKC